MTPQILVLGTADWDQPIATNQHYVVRELARAHPLTYVESMGLRTPELKWRDIKRGLNRLSANRTSGERGKRPTPAGVTVISPKVLPRHVGMARRFNRPVIHRLVQSWADADSPKILWTYTPVTYGLEAIADAVVYHCVDLLGKVEGIPERLINSAESDLAQFADVAIGTSEKVVEHLRRVGFSRTEYWPNVADTEVFARNRPAVDTRKRGRAVFAGNLSTTKVNFELLRLLARAGIDLHLAGPIAQGGGSAHSEVRSLEALGATYHGMLGLDELASLYWTANVGLIPYALNPYTSGVNPLKTFEYLATGMVVVSTAIPSVRPIEEHVVVTTDDQTFLGAVQKAMSHAHLNAVEERIEIAESHSWTSRGQTARTLLAEWGITE